MKHLYKKWPDKKTKYDAVIVLGHPDYYPRFGFKPADNWGIKVPFDIPYGLFMVLELNEGILSKYAGTIDYPKEYFDAL